MKFDIHPIVSVTSLLACSLALPGCSQADAAKDSPEAEAKTEVQANRGGVNIHCTGRAATRSRTTGDTSIKPIAIDYVIDGPNQRVLEYSIEKQAMQPLGTSDQCRTTVTDKMARVQCQASLTQEFGMEIITADTRIDRVLGKLRLDVDIQKRYGIRDDLNPLEECQSVLIVRRASIQPPFESFR